MPGLEFFIQWVWTMKIEDAGKQSGIVIFIRRETTSRMVAPAAISPRNFACLVDKK